MVLINENYNSLSLLLNLYGQTCFVKKKKTIKIKLLTFQRKQFTFICFNIITFIINFKIDLIVKINAST